MIIANVRVGLALIVLGQLARSYAMAHAGTNFSHLVAARHEQGHVLVTTGIYGLLRHPSYFGFFWWGIGTQIMLGNPVCTVGYACVLWMFFSSRIRGWFYSRWLGVELSANIGVCRGGEAVG